MRKYAGGSLASTTTYKPASALNQMLGWTSGETNALYTYDANGNCQDKFIIVDGENEATNYEYDEDNRLVKVTLRDTEQPKVYSFAYDYRTRRISRSDPAEINVFVFSDGLSVQEYNVPQTSSPLTTDNLTTESVHTEGYGGGVGGMIYSVRNGQIECSHSNHRGDVVARTDNRGTLSYFARYSAYGTRFHEVGNTYDRQWANTKDEETSFNGLNEGERWRCLNHGVMFQPDPLGYYDGPNRYAYVGNNPITHYDARGLYVESFIEIASIGIGFHSLRGNIKSGNIKSAWADAGGLFVDGLTLAVPGIPGGVGIGLKVKRAKKMMDAIDTTTETLKSADKLGDTLNATKTVGKEVAEKIAKETSEKAAKETAETVSQKASKEIPSKQKTKAKDRRKADKERSGKKDVQEKRTPGNNQAQNKQFKDATEGLTKDQKRQVHEQISKKNKTFKEIKEIAGDMKNTEK